MSYKVELSTYAIRQLKKIAPAQGELIKASIKKLSNDPRPGNHIKLTNYEVYRIRVGNFRVMYEIEDAKLHVMVIEIADRKEVYKKR